MTWFLLALASFAAAFTRPFLRHRMYRRAANALGVLLLLCGLATKWFGTRAPAVAAEVPVQPEPERVVVVAKPKSGEACPPMGAGSLSVPGSDGPPLSNFDVGIDPTQGSPGLLEFPEAEVRDVGMVVTKPVEELFEVPETGRYVFVIDCSGSMTEVDPGATKSRLQRVKDWFRDRFANMPPGLEIAIVCFSDGTPTVLPEMPRAGEAGAFFTQWSDVAAAKLDAIDASGGTEVIPALQLALRWNVDQVYVLSDGAFAGDPVGWLREHWRFSGSQESRLLETATSRELPIYGTFFGSAAEATTLREMTRMTGGDLLVPVASSAQAVVPAKQP